MAGASNRNLFQMFTASFEVEERNRFLNTYAQLVHSRMCAVETEERSIAVSKPALDRTRLRLMKNKQALNI